MGQLVVVGGEHFRITGKLLALFLSAISFFLGAVGQDISIVDLSSYGTMISSHKDYIHGAVAEKITLYPRKNRTCNANEVIERDALLIRYKDAVGTILMCHGFMCNKVDMGVMRRLFPRGRFNIMSFDFRAHGSNPEGQQCTFGLDEACDVLAAAYYIKNDPVLKNQPLFVYGFSMGAVAAIEAQALDPSLFQAMVLDCPFDSSEEVIKRLLDTITFSFLGYKFKMPGRTLLQRYAFHPYIQSLVKVVLKTVASLDPHDVNINLCPITPKESVKKVSVPTFFIVCKKDQRAPIDAVRALYDGAASTYKVLWLTNGRGHFDSYFNSPEKYTDKIRAFLEESLNGHAQQVMRQEITEDDIDYLV